MNDIPGFEWADRGAFAESVFDDDSPQQADEAETAANADADATRRLDDLADRVDRLETDRGGASTTSVDISPDLAHRVVHACMESDRISEDEELELLAAFMGGSS
jgi:hypothetical protein